MHETENRSSSETSESRLLRSEMQQATASLDDSCSCLVLLAYGILHMNAYHTIFLVALGVHGGEEEASKMKLW